MKKILNFIVIMLASVLLISTPLTVTAETKLISLAKEKSTKDNTQNGNNVKKKDNTNNSENKADNKNNADNTNNKNNLDNKNNKASKDLIETAKDDGRFKILIAAIDAAGLTEQLKADEPFTIFAPTDEAFEKLPDGTLDNLLKPENKAKLADILSYHISKNIVNSKDITNLDGKELPMLNEKTLIVTKKNNTIFVNSSKVIATDIYSKNGIIHVIDAVLIPQ